MTNIEVPGLFDRAWCDTLAARLDGEGFGRASPEYPRSYRTNARWVRDDAALAEAVFARARPHLPEVLMDEGGTRWTLAGLNPRMRACRYGAGEAFGVHRDGVCWRGAAERSFLSILVYLDEGFVGGSTRVFADRSARVVTAEVAPRCGSLAIIDHTWWHDGAPVIAGVKRVLRTDALYRAVRAVPAGHLGYVWALAALDDGALASGGRDRAIRLWRGGREVAVAERAHAASVTCLAAGAGGVLSGSRDRTVAWWRRAGDGLAEVARAEAHAGAVLAVMAAGDDAISAGADGAVARRARDGRAVWRVDAHDGWAWAVADAGAGRVVSVGDDGRWVVSEAGRVVAARALGAAIAGWGGAPRVAGVDEAPREAAASGASAALGVGAHAGAGVDAAVGLRAVCALGGGHFAVGTAAGHVALVRGQDAAIVAVWRAHAGPVTSLARLGDRRLASGGEDDRARVWRLDARGPIALAEHVHRDFVRAVCAVPGGWASAGYDGGAPRVDVPMVTSAATGPRAAADR